MRNNLIYDWRRICYRKRYLGKIFENLDYRCWFLGCQMFEWLDLDCSFDNDQMVWTMVSRVG
ncbi:hypothetical protein Hanom_Chr02g00145141 [Helianthus anomalus]